jgi:hypothetical protein
VRNDEIVYVLSQILCKLYPIDFVTLRVVVIFLVGILKFAKVLFPSMWVTTVSAMEKWDY